MTVTGRLGLLFLFGGGKRAAVRFALLVIGTSIGVLCLLTTLALPQVIKARQDRVEARMPVTERGRDSTATFHSVVKRIGADPLPITYVAADPGAPTPPGLDRLPAEGEAYVSPALMAALEQEPGLDEVVPQDVVGTISPDGLVGPDEWFAYVGAAPEDLGRDGRRLAGFGSDLNPEVDLSEGDVTFVNLSLLGVVGVPLLVYFAITARLSAAARLRRLAALRLIGMTVAQTQRVNAFESGVAAVLGGALGLAAYSLVHPVLASRGVGGMTWFASDSRAAGGLLFVSLVVIPIAATLTSRVGARRAVRNALATRRQADRRPPNAWRLIPLAIGSAILLALVVVGSTKPPGAGLGDRGATLLVIGVALTAVGLVVGFEVVPVSLGRMLARRSDRLSVLLGMRRLEFEPAGPSRVVGGLVIVVFVMGFATGLQRDAEAVNLPRGETQVYELAGSELGDVALPELASMQGVTAAAARGISDHVDLGGRDAYVDLTWATCADLRILLENSLERCPPSGFRVEPLRERPLTAVPAAGTTLMLPAGKGAPASEIEVPSTTIRLPLGVIVKLGNLQVVLPPEDIPKGVVPRGGHVLLASRNDPATLKAITLQIASVAPQASVRFTNANFDATRRAVIARGILNESVLIGLIVGLAAFVVASLDRIVERRQNLVGLTIVGVPIKTQRTAQALQVLVPMVAGVVIAIVAGKLAEQATVMLGGAASGWEWGATLRAVIAGAIACVTAVGASMLAIRSRVDVSLIRRE